MNTHPTSRYGLSLAAIAVATLAACASAPSRHAALDDAQAAYDRVASDPQVARSASLELRRAQQDLQQAQAAQRDGKDPSAVEHYAYLAKQRAEVALQAGKAAQAEQAVADASLHRDSILIEARTQEADKARLVAETQRGQAEAAGRLADERLVAAQASQAQTATARARSRNLEEQLAELKARPTERGMVLTLGDVLFDSGRAQLKPGATRTLDELSTFLKENQARTIEIEGYTDAMGDEASNQMLSERRALAVRNALIDRGIEPRRLSARGYGEAKPVANNGDAAGRQRNRRVEIVFSDNG